ncbi:hypothetical protein ACFCZ1_38520, partial [Streptomyces sp. NPDC056224]
WGVVYVIEAIVRIALAYALSTKTMVTLSPIMRNLARQQKISFRTVKQPLFLHALLAIIEILVHQARSPIYARSALYVAYTKIDSKDLPLQPVKLIRPFQSSKTSNIPKSFFIHFYCWA